MQQLTKRSNPNPAAESECKNQMLSSASNGKQQLRIAYPNYQKCNLKQRLGLPLASKTLHLKINSLSINILLIQRFILDHYITDRLRDQYIHNNMYSI